MKTKLCDKSWVGEESILELGVWPNDLRILKQFLC